MKDSIILEVILNIILIFLIPFIFMLIWNYIIPELCGFNMITYWQSFFLGVGIRLINGTLAIRRKINE